MCSKMMIRPILRAYVWVMAFFALGMFFPCDGSAFVMPKKAWELDGFVRNNTGVWTENWDYTYSNDPLATCRNWFRLNLNGGFTPRLDLKAEVLAVYEPEYARERGAGVPANEYNYFDFRELYLNWNFSPGQNIVLGRQIVNWGEAISIRVGDVINPQDMRFDLGFTNLEDTRMPIWMARGLHRLNFINSNIDWIFSPYMQPDRYRVTRSFTSALTVNSDGTFTPAQRFALYPETRIEKLFGTHNAMIAVPGAGPGGTTIVAPGPVSGPPFSYMYRGLDLLGGPVAPIDAATAASIFGPAFIGTPYPAMGVYLARPPAVTVDYPGSSLSDSRYGFKTSTAIEGWQTGVYFWHGNDFIPTFRVKGGLAAGLNIILEYPSQNVYGIYGNKNFSFGVLAFDMAYRPNKQYNTLDYGKYPEGITHKDNLLAQARLMKDFMWPKLNPGAPFSLTMEYVGEFILEDLDDVHVPSYFIKYRKESHTLLTSMSTGYRANMYNYGLTLIYNTRGCGLFQPDFKYTPDFLNSQLSFKIQYINVFGNDNYTFPYGLLRDSDMVILTTQYSF